METYLEKVADLFTPPRVVSCIPFRIALPQNTLRTAASES